jgi:hypothetical protein
VSGNLLQARDPLGLDVVSVGRSFTNEDGDTLSTVTVTPHHPAPANTVLSTTNRDGNTFHLCDGPACTWEQEEGIDAAAASVAVPAAVPAEAIPPVAAATALAVISGAIVVAYLNVQELKEQVRRREEYERRELEQGNPNGAPEPTVTTDILPPVDPNPPDERTEKHPMINLDTGSLVALASVGNERIRNEVRTHLLNRRPVATETAVSEFERTLRVAGPRERERATGLLSRVAVVPDNPSDRARLLRTTGRLEANDIVVLGTGDRLGIPTVTSDAKAVRASVAQGVIFNVRIHEPSSFVGQ